MTMNNQVPLRVVITGATGMVGEGVLHECLLNDAVEQILLLSRKPSGVNHPKVKELVHADFFNLNAIRSQLIGYNACFFCLGVSSVGMSKDEYYKITHELTLYVADTLSRLNTGMTFCYVSGAGTDSSEKGFSNWARVKGKTENYLKQLPFKQVYNFRPGFLKPTPGLTHTHPYYKYIGWLFPVLSLLFTNSAGTLRELGLAMINATLYGYYKQTITVKDIRLLANVQVNKD